MATTGDIVNFMIAGGVLMLVPIMLIAYFQAGFFGAWLRSRLGRGKYVLIKVRSQLRDYFTYGQIKGEFLIFGKKEKTKRILIDSKAIYRSYGVACVDINESKNAICEVDYEAVSGFDAEKMESLYIRALYRPSLEENKDKLLLLLVIVAIVVGVIGLLLSWNISQQITSIGGVSGGITSVL